MRRLFLILGVTVLLSGCKEDVPPGNVTGSGSTFVWPIMSRWMPEYEKSEGGAKIVYRPTGSSAGVKDFLERRVDFACSDGPLSDDEMARLKKQGDEVVHIPLILSAVVAVYNLEGINEPIRFTGPILADIYLGKIKKWNDPALKSINPSIQLPDQDIVVVHRSDGSGTTYIWTDYLAKLSPDWKGKVGASRDVTWPLGIGAKGNEGVAAKVRETPASIGCLASVGSGLFSVIG